MKSIFYFLFLYSFSTVYAVSNGANEPIADNQLGLTAKDCALQYCEDKDGMALWLSLLQECNVQKANPYFREVKEEKKVCDVLDTKGDLFFTPQTSGMICGMMSLIGFLLGYSYYDQPREVRYQELPLQELED